MPVSKRRRQETQHLPGCRVVGDTLAIDAAARADSVGLLPNAGSKYQCAPGCPVGATSLRAPYWTSPCGRAVVYVGDMRQVLETLDRDQFHAVVTDPPYALTSEVATKRSAFPRRYAGTEGGRKGFMGATWDAPGYVEDAAFGYYLSGLVDGEGCFRIHKEKGGNYYTCHFHIKMRRDDRAILERVKKFLEVGRIAECPARGGSKPQCSFTVNAREDCVRVREVFKKYKLRAKKLRDFLVWSEALDSWLDQGKGNRWHGPALKQRMRDAYFQIQQVREYRDPPWSGHPFQDWLRECAEQMLRVSKPGTHLLCFGGTRTHHRATCGIEDAGWSIRDALMWLYSTGFPKSHDVSKAIDDMYGVERTEVVAKMQSGLSQGQFSQSEVDGEYDYKDEYNVTAPATEDAKHWDGWGTTLKPAWEPVIVARKEVEGSVARNTVEHGCGGLNIDACRIGTTGTDVEKHVLTKTSSGSGVYQFNSGDAGSVSMRGGFTKTQKDGRWPANVVLSHSPECRLVGKSPTAVGTSAQPDEEVWECAADCPVPMFPTTGPTRPHADSGEPLDTRGQGSWGFRQMASHLSDNGGSAARFFYTSKADHSDRPHGKGATSHPTVKPLDLMRWLVRLVCAPGGTVLDPFMGSGSTGCAAIEEGMRFVGIEQSEEYADIAVGRLRLALEKWGSREVPPAPEGSRSAPTEASADVPPPPRRLRR